MPKDLKKLFYRDIIRIVNSYFRYPFVETKGGLVLLLFWLKSSSILKLRPESGLKCWSHRYQAAFFRFEESISCCLGINGKFIFGRHICRKICDALTYSCVCCLYLVLGLVTWHETVTFPFTPHALSRSDERKAAVLLRTDHEFKLLTNGPTNNKINLLLMGAQ